MRKLRDSEIEQWVLREIGLSNAIGSREISVLSRNGVVTLEGTVNNLTNKVAATRAAQFARGVVGVVNEISVNPSSPLISEPSAAIPLAVWQVRYPSHHHTSFLPADDAR